MDTRKTLGATLILTGGVLLALLVMRPGARTPGESRNAAVSVQGEHATRIVTPRMERPGNSPGSSLAQPPASPPARRAPPAASVASKRSASHAPYEESVTGLVKDEAGYAVPGATVTVRDAERGTSTTQTDGSGRFTWPSSYPANVFEAGAVGYASSLQVRTQPNIPLVLVLRKSHYLAGRITGPESKPQRGIVVRALSFEGADYTSGTATSGADGRYRIEGLADANYFITLHEGNLSQSVGEVHSDRSDADFAFGVGGLEGKVIDLLTSAPCKEFTIKVSQMRPTSETLWVKAPVPCEKTAEGFVARDLRSGNCHVEITAADGRVGTPDTVLILSGNAIQHQTFTVASPRALFGRVTTKASGKPLAGVAISVERRSWWHTAGEPVGDVKQTVTDDSGSFRVELSVGDYSLEVVPPPPYVGCVKQVVMDALTDNKSDVVVAEGGLVKGRLTGIEVVPLDCRQLGYCSGPSLSGRTEINIKPDGSFELPPMEQGTYRMTILGSGACLDFQCPPTGEATVLIALGDCTAGARFTGPPARSGAQTWLTLRHVDYPAQSWGTTVPGKTELRYLPPGLYNYSYTYSYSYSKDLDPDAPFESGTVRLEPGKPGVITLSPPPAYEQGQ